MNFACGFADDLGDQVAAAAQVKFLREHPQGAVRGDEIYRLYSLVALEGEKEMPQEQGPAGAGCGHGQVARRLIGQAASSKL